MDAVKAMEQTGEPTRDSHFLCVCEYELDTRRLDVFGVNYPGKESHTSCDDGVEESISLLPLQKYQRLLEEQL